MDHRRPRRVLGCEDLESRVVPAFAGPPPIPQPSTLVAPVERTDPAGVSNHALFAAQARAGTDNVVFYGDQFAYNFAYGAGSAAWAQSIAPLGAQAFGLPGDTVANVLWRIENGELVGSPKVAVVAVGINDLIDGVSVASTVGALESVATVLHARSPSTEIVLMGLLPASGPTSAIRAEIARVNAALAAFAPADNTLFINPGPSLTDPSGEIFANFQANLVDLNPQGYATVANDLVPTISNILSPPPGSVSVPPYVISPAERTDPNIKANEALFAQQAQAQTANVVFYGDSITYNFAYWYGSQVWAQRIAPLLAQDFGIPSDTAENLLWRIENGELVGSPKVAVVAVGINDLVMDQRPVPYTVAAIEAVVQEIQARSPSTRILLEGVLPGFGPTSPVRTEVKQVNAALANYAAARGIAFVDPGPSLIDPTTGSIAANFNPDLGHPNAQGYTIIANDLLPEIEALLNSPG